MYLFVRIAMLLVAVFALAPSAFAGDCTPLMQRIASYEREVGKAIQDEPEDLPKELGRHAQARDSGRAAEADRIENKVRSGFAALQAIEAPPDVSRFHAGMINYYRAGVAVLDAHANGDEAARRAAEIDTWLGLRGFFTNLRDLFADHDCMSGEVEAIDQNYLPSLDAKIALMRQGAAAPSSY